MLVKFNSDVGGFTMFGDVALTLLKMMGHSGTVPSAILPDDIPAAIERLEAALASSSKPPSDSDNDDDQTEAPISVGQRAFPLLELLRNAARENCSVMWDRE